MKSLAVALVVATLVVPAGAWAEEAQPTPAPAAAADEKKAPSATPSTTTQAQPSATTAANSTPSAGSAVLTPEQLAKLSGFFFSFGIDHYLGLGTFVDQRLYASLVANLNAFISYRTRIFDRAFAIGIQPFGLLGFSYEYTLPNTSNGRRLSWSDARLALSMPALVKEKNTGIVMTPSFNIIVPTTIESWGAGLISRLGFGLSMNRNFKTPIGTIITNFGGLGTLGLYTNSQTVVQPTTQRDINGNLVVLCRAGESICGVAGNNTLLALQGSLSATWAASDSLFVSVSYGLQAGWKYAATDTVDAATPKGVDANGNPVARAGVVRSADTQSASVSVSFNLTDAISGTVYLSNWSPLLSSDLKSIRFPLVDVTGLANNNTGVGFSLSAVY